MRNEGTTYLVSGEIPYEDADDALGLAAGNRIQFRIYNSAITSKNALPSGVIFKVLKSDGTYNEYTKDAFETDGSVIYVGNVNALRTAVLQITWTAGVTTSYTIDTTKATLEAAE